ncbi:hypothetical protein OGATHE_001852 [Ogataea polymorpha]|uniref:Uncharacterized protein n=1 Tax=Ogataea polymorpha TaxID=460523 RepID=A0A9P8PLZ5_9ASCO|nr:hypothetical protein OGATHE_001852 [Ogataea polymorpha]
MSFLEVWKYPLLSLASHTALGVSTDTTTKVPDLATVVLMADNSAFETTSSLFTTITPAPDLTSSPTTKLTAPLPILAASSSVMCLPPENWLNVACRA